MLTYYAFTTLSTVGLGDYHPVTDNERISCAFIMLYGVMVTSIVMESFSLMLKELRNFNKSYEESAKLNLFLGTLKKFNEYIPLQKNYQQTLEDYFNYRWNWDRNFAIST